MIYLERNALRAAPTSMLERVCVVSICCRCWKHTHTLEDIFLKTHENPTAHTYLYITNAIQVSTDRVNCQPKLDRDENQSLLHTQRKGMEYYYSVFCELKCICNVCVKVYIILIWIRSFPHAQFKSAESPVSRWLILWIYKSTKCMLMSFCTGIYVYIYNVQMHMHMVSHTAHTHTHDSPPSKYKVHTKLHLTPTPGLFVHKYIYMHNYIERNGQQLQQHTRKTERKSPTKTNTLTHDYDTQLTMHIQDLRKIKHTYTCKWKPSLAWAVHACESNKMLLKTCWFALFGIDNNTSSVNTNKQLHDILLQGIHKYTQFSRNTASTWKNTHSANNKTYQNFTINHIFHTCQTRSHTKIVSPIAHAHTHTHTHTDMRIELCTRTPELRQGARHGWKHEKPTGATSISIFGAKICDCITFLFCLNVN